MSEPNETPGKSGTDDKTVTISEAELEALKAQSERLKKLDGIAAEAELANAEAYLEVLEDETVTLRRQLQSSAKPTDDQPPDKKPDPPAKVPEPNDEISKEMSRLFQSTSQATIESQMANYRVIEITKPEEERHTYTRAELEKILKSDGPVVASLMNTKPELERNMFAAAAYVLDIHNGKLPGKTTDDRLNGSTAASLNPGSRAAKAAEEKVKNEVEDAKNKIRDSIAPVRGGYTGD